MHNTQLCRGLHCTQSPMFRLRCIPAHSLSRESAPFFSFRRNLWQTSLGSCRGAVHTSSIASSPTPHSCLGCLITSTCLPSYSTSVSWGWWNCSAMGTQCVLPSRTSWPGQSGAVTLPSVEMPHWCHFNSPFRFLSSIAFRGSPVMGKQDKVAGSEDWESLCKKSPNTLRTGLWKPYGPLTCGYP